MSSGTNPKEVKDQTFEDIQEQKDSNPWFSATFFLRRWRLALLTIPMLCLMVSFRLAVWYGGNIPGWIAPSVFQTFIVLAVFVSAVLLQGVVQDYKESEKMSSELECAFRDLITVIKVALFETGDGNKHLADATALYRKVEDLLFAVIMVIEAVQLESSKNNKGDHHVISFHRVLEIVNKAEIKIYQIVEGNLESKSKRLGKPLEIIRKTIARMYVIQQTSYIAACYSLMDAMILIVLTLMATTAWPRETAAGTAIAFTVIITFLFSFLWLFIRALEDPFEYPESHNLNCYAAAKRIQMNMREEIRYGASMDMSILFVDFGQQLRDLIYVVQEDPAIFKEIKGRMRMLTAKSVLKESGADEPSPAGPNAAESTGAAPKDEGKRLLTSPTDDEPNGDGRERLRRWYLIALSLPLVLVMVAVRLVVWYCAGVGGWLSPRIFLSFISLTVFVMTLLLQGLIQDYKEAEKMPSELLCAFQGLEAAVTVAARASEDKPPFSESDALDCVLTMLLAVVSVADNDTPGDTPADLCFARASESVCDAEERLLVGLIRVKVESSLCPRQCFSLRPLLSVLYTCTPSHARIQDLVRLGAREAHANVYLSIHLSLFLHTSARTHARTNTHTHTHTHPHKHSHSLTLTHTHPAFLPHFHNVRDAEELLLLGLVRAQAFDSIAGLRPIETVRQVLGRIQVMGGAATDAMAATCHHRRRRL